MHPKYYYVDLPPQLESSHPQKAAPTWCPCSPGAAPCWCTGRTPGEASQPRCSPDPSCRTAAPALQHINNKPGMSLSFESRWLIRASGRQILVAQIRLKWPGLNEISEKKLKSVFFPLIWEIHKLMYDLVKWPSTRLQNFRWPVRASRMLKPGGPQVKSGGHGPTSQTVRSLL